MTVQMTHTQAEESFDEANHSEVVLEQSVEPTPEMSEEESAERLLRAKRVSCCQKLVLASIIIGFIIFVIVDSTSSGYLKQGINSFLGWIQRNAAAGFFAFMAVYFVATVLFIPGSVLTFGAGFVFAHEFGLGLGVLLGSISVFIGAYAGATVGFLIARFVLREWVQNFAKKYAIFEALEAAFAEKGFQIMTLIRLSPIIPFSAINYIAGITSLSFRNYELALFFILPGTILYVFLGASAGSLTASADSGDINLNITVPVIVVGIVLGVFAVGLTSYYAKNELNRVVEKRRLQQEAEAAEGAGDEEAPQSGSGDEPEIETEIISAPKERDLELEEATDIAPQEVDLNVSTNELGTSTGTARAPHGFSQTVRLPEKALAQTHSLIPPPRSGGSESFGENARSKSLQPPNHLSIRKI